MKLSVMIYSFSRTLLSRQMSLPEVLKIISDLGVEGVDISSHLMMGMKPLELYSIMRNFGLQAICYIVNADFVHVERKEREKAIEVVKHGLNTCVELESPLMMIVTGVTKEGIDTQTGRHYVIEGLNKCVPVVQSAGITLSIENFPGVCSPHCTSTEVLEVCNAVHSLKIVYDVGNILTGGEDPVKAFHAMAPYIVHSHMKDWVIGLEGEGIEGRGRKFFKPALVGEGIIDYPTVLSEMSARGYNGYLAFEYEGEMNSQDAVRRGITYLRSVLQGL